MLRNINLYNLGIIPTKYFIFVGIILLTIYFFNITKNLFNLSRSNMLVVFIISTFIPYLGAKLFHTFFSTSSTPGLSYYGAIISQIYFLYLYISKTQFIKIERKRIFIIQYLQYTSLVLIFLRLECLLNGCCWGKYTTSKTINLVFHNYDAITPLTGLQLEPTQVYYILHGMIILSALTLLNKFKDKLLTNHNPIWIFFLLLSIGRLSIDQLRGDWNLFSPGTGFHYNGIISMVLLAICLSKLLNKKILLIPIFSLFATSCIMPKKLPKSSFSVIDNQSRRIEYYDVENKKIKNNITKKLPNLMLVIVDEISQGMTSNLFENNSSKDYARFEDRYWWRLSKKIKKNYNKVVRIHWSSFDISTFKEASEMLESFNNEYDVFILGHGFPNHIVSSAGKRVIDWRDLQSLKGKLPYARLFYLSTCYGASLEKEILEMGAKRVLSYENLNNNLIFQEFLIKKIKQVENLDSLDIAIEDLLTNYEYIIRKKQSLELFVKFKLKMNYDDYINKLDIPTYYGKPNQVE